MWDTLGNTGKTRHNEESKGKNEQMKPKEKQKALPLYPSSCDVK